VLTITDPTVGRAARADGERNLKDALIRLEELLRDRALDEARVEAEALAAMHPGEPQAHLVLARVHLAAGRGREAEEAVRTTLRLDPMCAPAHRLLGDALATRGRFHEAAEWWQRWLAVHGSGQDGEVEQTRAAIQAAETLRDMLRRRHGG
jgi:Flp pilus assembly protein TadD